MPKKETKAKAKPKGKRVMVGVSYTDRSGKRVHVMRKDFPTLDAFVDRAENIMLYAKNPRVLHARVKK